MQIVKYGLVIFILCHHDLPLNLVSNDMELYWSVWIVDCFANMWLFLHYILR